MAEIMEIAVAVPDAGMNNNNKFILLLKVDMNLLPSSTAFTQTGQFWPIKSLVVLHIQGGKHKVNKNQKIKKPKQDFQEPC